MTTPTTKDALWALDQISLSNINPNLIQIIRQALARQDVPTVTADEAQSAEEWFGKVVDGNIEESYPSEVKTIRSLLAERAGR